MRRLSIFEGALRKKLWEEGWFEPCLPYFVACQSLPFLGLYLCRIKLGFMLLAKKLRHSKLYFVFYS